jgi:hypothetical protein
MLQACSAIALLPGCAQLLDANDFSKTRDAGSQSAVREEPDADRHPEAVSDANSGPAIDAAAWPIDPGTLLDPKPPYLSGDECTACIKERCQAEDANCAGNDFCSDWLAEARAHEGPLAAANELWRKYDDARWTSDRGETSDWPVLDGLRQCVIRKCVDECELGRDFSCFGNFAWQASYPKRTELRVRPTYGFDRTQGYDDWTVRACAPIGVCTPPLGEGKTQGGGFVSLSVDLSLSIAAGAAEFTGLLDMQGGPEFFPVQALSSRPFFDHVYLNWGFVPRLTYEQFAEQIKFPLDPERALVDIEAQDCSGSWIHGVVYEIWNWNRDSGNYEPCPSAPRDHVWNYPNELLCGPLYTAESGLLDTALSEVETPLRSGWGRASGRILIVTRDHQTGFPLSAQEVRDAPAGYLLLVLPFPASSQQLKSFPKEAWTPALPVAAEATAPR